MRPARASLRDPWRAALAGSWQARFDSPRFISTDSAEQGH